MTAVEKVLKWNSREKPPVLGTFTFAQAVSTASGVTINIHIKFYVTVVMFWPSSEDPALLEFCSTYAFMWFT